MSSASMDMTDPNAYAEALLRDTRDELAKADAKASILLATSGIGLAALLSNGSDSTWYPNNLAEAAARISAWTALGLTLLGIALVGAAVKPRLRAKHERTSGKVHYFGDVEAFRPNVWRLRHRNRRCAAARTHFIAALQSVQRQTDYADRLADQVWVLSHVAYRKYRLLSLGMWIYLLALLAGLVAFFIENKWL
jgi:hypothetical protein